MIKKLHKKGYSTGFTWVFGLVTLFGLGILYITFTQVFDAHLVPTIKDLTDNSTSIGAQIPGDTSIFIHGQIDKYMDYFHMLPFVLFFLVIIYMLIAAIRKEGESGYL
jgi:hypothetical protein